MNGVNNQLINLAIAQESNTAQNGQEIQRMAVNAAESSNHEPTQNWKPRIWTEEKDRRFIELKQQQPGLAWKEFAKHFPGTTGTQCSNHWNSVLKIHLYQEEKLIDVDAKDMNPEAATPNWTTEENQRFIKLKEQQPTLSWKEFAKHFPGHTDLQCTCHWHQLKIKLNRKRKLKPEEDFYNHPTKKLRIKLPSPTIPAIPGGNTHLSVNSSQEIPEELAVLPISSPSDFLQTEGVNAAIFISSSKEDSSTSCNPEEADSFKPPSLDELKKMAVNAAESSNHEFIRKMGSRAWTEEEDRRFIELKQQQPTLAWKEFAKHFPGRTSGHCADHWNSVLKIHLYQEEKLIDVDAKHMDPEAANRLWSKEENQRFIKLKEQQPTLSSQEFAKHFPGHTARQCIGHWARLKIKLNRKRKLKPEEDFYNHLTKRLRIELPSPTIPAIPGENTHLSVNSSQEIPQELAVLPVSGPSDSLQELQKILDFPLYHYELAVNHFQEIQLKDPLLQSFQQETTQLLAHVQTTYQEMKQRLTETDGSPIIQQAKSLANFCQTSIYYLETVYQHYLSYQTSRESKEWFTSQSEEFANLYLVFFKGKMNETDFHHFTSLKEKEYCYQNLYNLFIQYRDDLKKHSSCFSLEYNKFMDESFFNIRSQFNLLKQAQQDWKSIVSGLEEVLSRLQEIEGFLRSSPNLIPSTAIESNIVARIRNEISLQDFYTKQAALMAVQKEGQ